MLRNQITWTGFAAHSDQSEINKQQGTQFNMPVLYYSQLMTIAYGGNRQEAGLDGQLIRAEKLEQIAAK